MPRDFTLSDSNPKITCFEGNISRHVGNMRAVSLGNRGLNANRILGAKKAIKDLAESEVNINILDRQPSDGLHAPANPIHDQRLVIPANNNQMSFK